MESVDMEETPHGDHPTEDDLCETILSRFSTSPHHHHLCSTIGAISQELKDHNLPTTPTAYFLSTCSSLGLLASDPSPSSPLAFSSLLTILSLSLPRLPLAVLRKQTEHVSGILVRVLKIDLADRAAEEVVVSGLKCVAYLLTSRNSVNWKDVAQLFFVVLNFLTDSRPKVRRQSHASLRDVLDSFQSMPTLSSASEGITNALERFLLLAGGSHEAGAPKGAQEVLYVLDALKECLPLMSSKYKATVLKYYRTLLELRQPMVTRRVTDNLYTVCLHPALDAPAEVLLDMMCFLALSVSSNNETSADGLTFTARLLSIGMRKVYALNREICVVKLPVVFSTLKDILASEHEESIFASTEALKNLINDCIDENLIRQGVDQIRANENMDNRMSGPTVIEKICTTVDSLLDYHYSAVWDMVFQVVSAMFEKLGNYSSYFTRETLKNLADVQRLPDEDFPYRKQLHECLGTAVGAMGPETFLNFLPLNVEADDLSDINVWLFPILKQYTVGAHLSYFVETILTMISLLRKKSHKLELEGRIVAARSLDGLVYSLWSLLPSFCNYPTDTAESFKELEKALCVALHEQPEVRGVICSSLQVLIFQNKSILENKSDPLSNEAGKAQEQAMTYYTMKVATDNLSVLKSSARYLLTVLSQVLWDASSDDGGWVQSTISEFASIADKDVVKSIFLKTMRKLVEATQKSATANSSSNLDSMRIDDSSLEKSPALERARLFDLAVSLLSGLGDREIGVLFSAVKPALQDTEGLVQKKAYKVLSIVLEKCDGFLQSRLEELLQLMIGVMPSCHFSAKRHRFDCLYVLMVHISKLPGDSEQRRLDILSSFLTEIILALKEANKKTRNKAYDILVQIGHTYGDEENGGRRENLYQFFNMVAGGMAGESPHMISAAVKGIARLAYEFSDLVSTAYKLLPSTFLLLQRKNREVIKASLGLLKVLVAKSQAEGLQMHLESMVEGLLKWQGDTKKHFKAKVKHLLEMLVRKCGLDAVKAVMPEEHMRLLTNIRKIKERKERKQAITDETRSQMSKATTSRLSKWNHTRIFSDFDEDTRDSDTELADVRTVSGPRSKASSQLKSRASLWSGRTRRLGKSLPEDLFDQLEDEPLDLLDRKKTRSALRSFDHLKRKQESDDEPEIDSMGRLVVYDGPKPKKEKRSDPDSDVRSEAGSYLSTKSTKKTKKRKTSETGWSYTGSEYASKKSGGDVKRKDKLEPYAYWPLDRKMMSRRPNHRAAARKGMASVVKMTKKLEGVSASGALSMKLKKSRKQKKGLKM